MRGIAIFTMIAANMAAYNYEEPHPFWFRAYGSFAAPAFILLSGFMVPFTSAVKNYNLWYFLVRGILIMLCGAAIDFFLWKLVPFTSFDVLYVIGFALPVSYLMCRVPKGIHISLAALFVVVTPLLQWRFGYAELPAEVSLDSAEGSVEDQFRNAQVLRSFLFEGWFPLFPWLGLALLGSFAGRIRAERNTGESNGFFLITGICLFIIGIVIWLLQAPELMVREGYSELFYPPTLGYLFTFLGLILTLIALLQPAAGNKFFRFFAVYGRTSLFMYILHTVIIVFLLKDFFVSKPLPVFAALYISHALLLWIISFLIQKIKNRYKLPFLLRFLLGG